MYKHTMGSTEGIERSEVAGILGLSKSAVDHLTRNGVLRIKTFIDRKAHYCPEEVSALKEARDRGHHLSDVAETAQQAWAAARVAQRRIESLERLLGMHSAPAHTLSQEDVDALHSEAYGDLGKPINGAARINYWADKFLSLCEIYFIRVAEVTEDKEEPWRVYQTLANQLVRDQNAEETFRDPEEVLAYRRLHTARSHLKHSIFLYLLQRYGRRVAAAAFPVDFQGEDYAITKLAAEAANHR